MVLHILLIILKIIGIIIAVILGLLLLLLVTFLCVPVRYRLDASMPGEIKESSAYGRVTWLLRLEVNRRKADIQILRRKNRKIVR